MQFIIESTYNQLTHLVAKETAAAFRHSGTLVNDSVELAQTVPIAVSNMQEIDFGGSASD